MPVFPLLNVTVRIIEPLATTFRKELLSGRSEVQILLATPEDIAGNIGFRRFIYAGNNLDISDFCQISIKILTKFKIDI